METVEETKNEDEKSYIRFRSAGDFKRAGFVIVYRIPVNSYEQ